MSLGRVLVAAIVGGILAFGWGAFSHMVLPLGEVGVKNLPAEQAIFDVTRGAIQERGFYFFPGMAEGESQEAWAAKYKAGPRGVLVYDPTGGEAMDAKMMGIEVASSALASLMAAIVLCCVCASYLGRVMIVAAMGVFGWAAIDVSYWNWYRFPTDFMLAQLADQALGWFVAGLGIAAIAKCTSKGTACCGGAPNEP